MNTESVSQTNVKVHIHRYIPAAGQGKRHTEERFGLWQGVWKAYGRRMEG